MSPGVFDPIYLDLTVSDSTSDNSITFTGAYISKDETPYQKEISNALQYLNLFFP